MKNYIVSLTLLFVLFSTLTNAVNIVPKTCKKISDAEPGVSYNNCVAAFRSDPRSSTASLGDLAKISFNLSLSKAKSNSKEIVNLLKDPKFDHFQKENLHTCQELYSEAPENLDAGLKALNDKDFNTANILVSGAIDWAVICEDGFRERSEFSPLTKQNDDFTEFATISLLFTILMK